MERVYSELDELPMTIWSPSSGEREFVVRFGTPLSKLRQSMLRQVQAFRRAEFGALFHGVRLDEEDGRKSSEKCFARHVRVGIVLDGYVGDVRGRESR